MGDVHAGMAQVIAAVSSIAKKRSEGVNYEFRGIDDVMNALHGPLSDAGLFLAPRVLADWQLNPIPGTNNRTQYQAVFRVAVDVYAADGSMVTLGPGLAQSHDYGDKAVYQAQQNAIKYLLLEAFAIPTAELDMDARQADESLAPPADTSPSEPSVGEFMATQVQALSKWSKEQREQAYKAVMAELGIDQLDTIDKAKQVFEGMHTAYMTEHPANPDEAPF